jgi:hypothetical protein
MSWTKRELIEEAFDSIGLASYSFDIQDDQYLSALRKLDAMMATWNGKGIRLSYPLHDNKDDSSVDEYAMIPDWANEAVYLNLAIRLAPSFGKALSPDVKQNANDAYDAIMTKISIPPEYQVSGLPKGQGYKSWHSCSTLPYPDEVITDGTNDTIDI